MFRGGAPGLVEHCDVFGTERRSLQEAANLGVRAKKILNPFPQFRVASAGFVEKRGPFCRSLQLRRLVENGLRGVAWGRHGFVRVKENY